MARTTFLLLGTCLASALAAPAVAQDSNTASAGEDIVVTGFRKSLQDSAATKRRANSIVDVISAEDVGKFPDNNVAESLSICRA